MKVRLSATLGGYKFFRQFGRERPLYICTPGEPLPRVGHLDRIASRLFVNDVMHDFHYFDSETEAFNRLSESTARQIMYTYSEKAP